jgi:hypothetical protein
MPMAKKDESSVWHKMAKGRVKKHRPSETADSLNYF